MAYFMFVLSVAACGAVLSLIPMHDSTTSREDYHYVPYAGDAFGA